MLVIGLVIANATVEQEVLVSNSRSGKVLFDFYFIINVSAVTDLKFVPGCW